MVRVLTEHKVKKYEIILISIYCLEVDAIRYENCIKGLYENSYSIYL